MGGYGKIVRRAQSGERHALRAMRFRAGRILSRTKLLLILFAFFVP